MSTHVRFEPNPTLPSKGEFKEISKYVVLEIINQSGDVLNQNTLFSRSYRYHRRGPRGWQ